ncbi:amidohydrolase family protein [Alteromonas sp. MMG017]|nr:amidohydrolase family protein [Alteromonas sp. MMG017]
MQPYHAIDDGQWAEERIGPKRLPTAYAFKSILEQGGLLTFGSDWPVAPLSPFEGIYAAVTRSTLDNTNPQGWIAEQKISVEQALTAYTVTNSYSLNDELKRGTLEKGKFADFVVLSHDPRTVPANLIREIKVLKHYINGELVYEY